MNTQCTLTTNSGHGARIPPQTAIGTSDGANDRRDRLVLWLARLRSIVNEHLATSKDDSSQTRKWDQVRDNELLLAEWALANVTFLNRQVGCHLVLAASFLEIAEARIEELLGKGNPNRAPTATNAAAETHEAADNSTPTSQNYIG